MITPKRLKDLPGFGLAMAELAERRAARSGGIERDIDLYFDDLADVVIPGLARIASGDVLWQLVLIIWSEGEQERRRLRVVPPPRPIVANDCEAP